MKESLEAKKKRALEMIKRLRQTYPDAKCALNYETPFQLLVATILSAQCTDKRVNMVTPELFKRFPDAKSTAQAKPAEIETLIQSAGFYKNKTKSILGAAKKITEEFDGQIPKSQEKLVTLPGVGRKTANVVLGHAYGIPGITVDTHMIRLNNLLGFTQHKDAVKIEFELMKIIPEKDWTHYSNLVIHHGRARCVARRPDCVNCEISDLCPSVRKMEDGRKKREAKKSL
ncbi:MAG: endonuclease III [Candidatus Omnitrophica bacterium]|nr:endonuclease III [Candidatus Omnitrophota bacterium]